jgi:predicted RNA binding protein YcfA (HicA-like mRNA interferase family)
VTVQQLIDMLQATGWRLTKAENDLRHFKHPANKLTVTLSGKLDLLVPPGIVKVIRRSTQLEENNGALRGDL